MTEKSYVGMGHSVCPICGAKHSEVVLLNMRLKSTFTNESVPIELKLCPEHQKMKEDGYIALIEVTNKPTSFQDADRTGQIAHVRASAWDSIFFDAPIPPGGVCFVEVGVIEKLKKLTEQPS